MRDTRLARPGLPGLPAGMEITCTRYGAVLACNDPMLQLAYSEITAASVRVPGSPYFLRHWLPEFGTGLGALILQIRCGAMRPRGAAFKHPDLARLACVHEDTIRRFVRWWEGQGPCPFRLPGDAAYALQAVRLYVPRIQTDPYYHGSGSAPYRYWPLDGEVLHRRHLPLLDTVRDGLAAGQREFVFPEVEAIGIAGAGRLVFELRRGTEKAVPQSTPVYRGGHPRGTRGSDSDPMSAAGLSPDMDGAQPMSTAGVGPPIPPHDSKLTESQQQPSHAEAENEGTGASGEAQRAAAALSALKAGRGTIRELLGYREGAFYVLLWATQIGPSKNWWSQPQPRYDRVAWVCTAVRACCRQPENPHYNPESGWYIEAQDWLARHREAQATAEKKEAEKHFRPRRPAPKPEPAAPALPEVPAELRPYWDTLLGTRKAPWAFETSRPVELHRRVLIVSVPDPTNLQSLQRSTAIFNAALQRAHPGEVHQVEFTLAKGDPHA